MKRGAALWTLLFYCLVPISSWAQAEPIEELSRQQLFSVIRDVNSGIDLFALPQKFAFPNDARDTSIFGVDFSHHQEEECKCHLDWNALAHENVRFVYLKLTDGTSFTDGISLANLPRVRQANLDAGVYHFLRSNEDADKQADHFIGALKTNSTPLQLAPSLDLEWNAGAMQSSCPSDAVIKVRKSATEVILRCDQWGFVSADDIIARANIWLDRVRAYTKQEPIVYTCASWWNARIGRRDRMKEIHAKLIWIADYSKSGLATEKPAVPPGASWDIWQFTDGAAVTSEGNKHLIDASIFNGSLDAFRKRLSSTAN